MLISIMPRRTTVEEFANHLCSKTGRAGAEVTCFKGLARIEAARVAGSLRRPCLQRAS